MCKPDVFEPPKNTRSSIVKAICTPIGIWAEDGNKRLGQGIRWQICRLKQSRLRRIIKRRVELTVLEVLYSFMSNATFFLQEDDTWRAIDKREYDELPGMAFRNHVAAICRIRHRSLRFHCIPFTQLMFQFRPFMLVSVLMG